VGPAAKGFSASNFAEAPSQIVVGFSRGSDSAAARRLSDDVVKALSKRWKVREVPDAELRGAFPLKECNA
jgi:hypothetical protein